MSRAGERLYRLLLKVLPSDFRRRYEVELLEVYRHRLRQGRGPIGVLRLWGHLLGDLAATAVRERRRERPAGAGGSMHATSALVWDLRRAITVLRRAPTVTLVIVATLALGVGGSTLVLSFMEATFLRGSALVRPERLVWITTVSEADGSARGTNLLDYADWRGQASAFAEMAAIWERQVTLDRGELPERVNAAFVSASYFDVVGVSPRYGRSFETAEETHGEHRLVVLGHGLWQRQFAGESGVLGRSVRIDGTEVTVIGIMPPGFPGPTSNVQLWMPLSFPPESWRWNDRSTRWMDGVLARLRPGQDLAGAEAEMTTITRALAAEYPDSNDRLVARLRGWNEVEYRETRQALLALGGGVWLLLLLGCANVASLLLVRANARREELSVCAALGASRQRLLRQLLVESSLLGLGGGALGALLAGVLLGPAVALAQQRVPGLEEARIDGSVLLAALVLSLVAAMLFGTWPAWRAAGDTGGLVDSSRRGSTRRHRGLRVLAAAEIALAALLLSGALLLGQTFRELLRFDPGFDPRGVLALDVALVRSDYPDGASITGYYQRLLERLAAVPGVEAVASSPYEQPLAGGGGWYLDLGVVGEPVPERRSELQVARFAQVSSDYFEVLSVPLIEGRGFDGRDREGTTPVAAINETAARRLFDGRDPIGEELWLWAPDDTVVQVVGVVGDLRVASLREEPVATIYVPWLQTSEILAREQTILLRGDPEGMASLAESARSAAREIDPHQPVSAAVGLDGLLVRSLGLERLSAVLALGFAGFAVILAGLGLYGVVSHTVHQQRREIGIRVALGGRARSVAFQVIGGVLVAVALGTGAGLAAAVLSGRWLASRLFGVTPYDAATFGLVAVILAVVSVASASAPFQRALRVDPMESLRSE